MLNGARSPAITKYALRIRKCGESRMLDEGRKLQAEIVGAGHGNDRFLGNLLVQMHGKCESTEDALATFEGICERNIFSWSILMTAFAENGHILQAENVFKKMPHTNAVAWTSMIATMASNGRLDSAKNMFAISPQRDAISWNAMISAFAQNGYPLEAMEVFCFMDLDGVEGTQVTFVSAIDACASTVDVHRGSILHACVGEKSFRAGINLESAIVNMYGKFGNLEKAKAVFDAMDVKNVVSWNTMISAFTKNSQEELAVSVFRNMMLDGVKPDQATFATILDAYSALNAFVKEGIQLCEMLQVEGVQKDLVLSTALINMYGKCGKAKEAKHEFDEIIHHDTASWNAMISAYGNNGRGNLSLQLFGIMNLEGVKADNVTIVAILDACSSSKLIVQGTAIRENIIQGSEFELDNMVQTALVCMGGRCGNLTNARMAFDRMNQRDCIAFNATIAAYAQNGCENEALDMFKLMDLEGVNADDATYVSILDACTSSRRNVRDGYIKEKFKRINIEPNRLVERLDLSVANALMNVNAKTGRIEDAKTMFDAMEEKSLVSWNTMLAAYAQRGYTLEAFQMLGYMDLEGISPDSITFTSILEACGGGKAVEYATAVIEECRLHNMEALVLLNVLVTMYGKCGNVMEARKSFDETRNRDLVSWNAMLGAYTNNGCADEALELFRLMDLEGVQPDEITFLEIIEGCSVLSDLRQGKLIHCCIMENCMETEATMNSLVNMYAKCGSLQEAQNTFNKIVNPSAVSWNAMAGAYAQFGFGVRAREMSRSMELDGSRASHLTFMSILSALSHKGFVYEAWEYFVSIQSDYNLESGVHQYICIVDVLSRVGELDAALEIINEMPYEPGHIAWATLLAACKVHGDLGKGMQAAEQLVLSSPDEAAPYILLSNILSADVIEELL